MHEPSLITAMLAVASVPLLEQEGSFEDAETSEEAFRDLSGSCRDGDLRQVPETLGSTSDPCRAWVTNVLGRVAVLRGLRADYVLRCMKEAERALPSADARAVERFTR